MKTLYISAPVQGKSIIDVCNTMITLQKVAEHIFEEELDPVGDFNVVDLEHDGLDVLARHIARLREADYFIGIQTGCSDRICEAETVIAKIYQIPRVLVDPDNPKLVLEVRR